MCHNKKHLLHTQARIRIEKKNAEYEQDTNKKALSHMIFIIQYV